MGFHTCEFCFPAHGSPARHRPANLNDHRYSYMSSGDVTLRFHNGHVYRMPDMILHYVVDHRWCPNARFVNDVMSTPFVSGGRVQTRSADSPENIGYLKPGDLDGSQGEVPRGFVDRLEGYMRQSGLEGGWQQTKGLSLR